MPRVIAGTAGGRRLAAPPGPSTRPTADRVKEAMFSSLGDVTDAVVLDLFAGSGGLGIEALSRGAASAVFVEQSRRISDVVGANLAAAGLADLGTVLTVDAARFCRAPAGYGITARFDLLLIDPPYAVAHDDIAQLVRDLRRAGALGSDPRVVLERNRTAGRDPLPGLTHDRERRYGDTTLHYYRSPPT
ncbi:16S rRNA (guanine(966)-N(2))-methyltransferase RsmD [Euzebya tangerina]|uniref:16S rRNA (guanine(966)-N(2))-methyltransferase RsmD n=1 Tax=Euzebya tangerina TaxID=591198 RepID=UPI000E318657|nr:16S rRNA (guanine(966)-N(2))-methyltransferase RsmD [Euzebya tangerina]